MVPERTGVHDAIHAFIHASVLLERLVPGCVVDDLDGLRPIRYGRLKVGVQYEILANDSEPGYVLAVRR